MDFQPSTIDVQWSNPGDIDAASQLSSGQPCKLTSSSTATPALGLQATDHLASQLLPLSQDALRHFNSSPSFAADIQKAFGSTANLEIADGLINHLANGSSWPEIKALPSSSTGAEGAFGDNTIFLSEDLLINPSRSEAAISVLLEEVGHYIDSQINPADAKGDEGAVFAKLVLNKPFQPGELASLQSEDDHGSIRINDPGQPSHTIAVEHSVPLGVFVVGATGKVSIDFLADAGSYRGEMAIFSLEGMEALTPGSVDFIKEASRRALSNSPLGYVAIIDPSEGARFSGELGESNKNDGAYPGPKGLSFNAGDRLALMLVPQGSVNEVFLNPNATGNKRPLFSIASANPNFSTQLGQLVSGAFGWEDLRVDQGTDADYNDIVFQIKGATGSATDLGSLIAANRDWRNLPAGKEISTFASPVGDVTLKLLRDTGLSNRDGITYDPRIQGIISNTGNSIKLSASLNDPANLVDFSVTIDGSGNFSIDEATLVLINRGNSLADGGYRLYLQADAGLGSPLLTSLDFVLDRTKPAAPANVTVKNDKDLVTNQIAPVLSGTGEANSLVAILQGSASLGQAIVSEKTWEIPLTKELGQGVFLLSATATDLAGNVSDPASLSLTIDTQPPVLTIITPGNNGVLAYGSRLKGSINGSGSDLDGCNYSFNDGPAIPLELDAEGNFDQEFDLTGLTAGSQQLTVKALDLAGNLVKVTIPVVLAEDKVPFFVGDLQSNSAGLFVGETAKINFKISVANPGGLGEVMLYEIDPLGAMTPVGALRDDGVLATGDDIKGDGLYNNIFSFAPTVAGEKSFVAVIPATLEKTPTLTVSVVTPISDQQFQATLDFNAKAETQLKSLLTDADSIPQALAQMKAILEASGDSVKVDSIVITDHSILWEDQDGIVSILNADAYLDGQRSVTMTTDLALSPDSQTINLLAATPADSCNHALVLSPYAFQFEPFDEGNEIAQKFRDADFSVVEKNNANVSVEDFKNLQKYTAIAITAHGDNFDGTNFGKGNQVVVLTGQTATVENKKLYSADLASKRLVLAGSTYAVTSSFIKQYTDKMPDSIVYIGSCRSTYTASLANSFLSEGSKAFIGYSNYVGSDFAYVRGQLAFDTLLKGKTTGDIPGINIDQETDKDPARFQLIGSKKATLTSAQLQNGDFEKGDFRCWVTEGDARIITALGPLSPPEGYRMAIISTGLGSVSDSRSSISQAFVVPDNADKLRLTYNVVSEEPMEFVGSAFDDRFQVLLDGTIVASESVNASVWLPVSSIDFAGGDSTVFQTGFKTVDLDLSPYRGKKVEFKLTTFDSGDSIYDTAAVVDNIKLLLK